MKNDSKECGICGAYFYEMGDSPLCEKCGKLMCPSCEHKHDKENCSGKN